GVPTVWLALVNHLERTGQKVESLKRITVGGSACPLSLITKLRETYDVEVRHAWGMTETSPLGTYNTFLPGMENLSEEEQNAIRVKQGRPVFGIDMCIADDDGNELPWDGKTT